MANKKGAAGSGSIRKKTITVRGKEYTYWEGRYTETIDPITGKQKMRSVSGKTQKEVAQKLREITQAIDNETYVAPSKMTVGEWLEIWAREYLVSVKPRTMDSYRTTIRTHLIPGLGKVKLTDLKPHTVQMFYNRLVNHATGEPLSPKTVKNLHGVLHKALQQAVKNGYLHTNPADSCELPKISKPELHPLNEEQIARFLKEIRGSRFEAVYLVTLFTGMREGEVLGLTWDCVDLDKGTIYINKQLQKTRGSGGEYKLVPTKNGKSRQITVAPFVVETLKKVKSRQIRSKLFCGTAWNETDMVFTDAIGMHLKHQTVYLDFKKIVKAMDCPTTRFHDLRHSFAMVSIGSGADIKTVQENLGHATASFTLDVYGHSTDRMKRESADKMEKFIHTVAG